MTQRILVTGSTGLVGSALVEQALSRGMKVRASSRNPRINTDPRLEFVDGGDLAPDTNWTAVLANVDTVVHCAARVHVMRDSVADPLAEFRSVNTSGTLHLARQAARARIERFVFISSVKVNGEFSPDERAFNESDPAAPLDAYGLSKHEAEVGLRQLAFDTGMDVVIVRPPLVYGPGVKANFAALLRAVQRGLPLPLGSVRNRRSLVALDNLVDFVLTCVAHPRAANQTFLVSDGHDLSTAQLVSGMASALGVSPRLVPVPVWLLRATATLAGKGDALQRLCGNLQVDISKARSLLDWEPPISVDQGLRRAVLGIKE